VTRNRFQTPIFLFFVLSISACGERPAESTVDAIDAASMGAALAAPDSYSAAAVRQVLGNGGNAVDAAIASDFVTAVTEPEAGNIGGGGFMLIWMNGKAEFLDYRETAPLAAYREMYMTEDAVTDESLYGHRAAGVPGTVAGLWAAHQRHGSLPWQELVAPAIKLADEGFIVHAQLAGLAVSETTEYVDRTNFMDYFSGLQEGQLFKQPELANVLRRIATHGRDGFYKGETADLIVADMEANNGLITREDLIRYEPVWREPLRGEWRGFDVLSAPPPSSGGFAVIQLLRIKDFLAHEFEGLAHNSPEYIHLVAEIEKRVFADRAEYLGDSDYVDVPMERLISDDYLRQRARDVDPLGISDTDGVAPGLESKDTSHISLVDQNGNAVANTYTLNLSFGAGVVVEGAGFLLNDEMDDFSAKPGVPNYYGVVGNVANEIQPGKRMLSSMSPTILLREGDVQMVVGSPGGSTIFTTVFQSIINVFDYEMSPQEAVSATRFHHQLLPRDLITYSPGYPLPDDVIGELSDRGYRIEPHDWEFGDLQIIVRDNDQWIGASDPRGRGEFDTVQ